MAANSKIEWCHHTVNFWWGCVFATLRDGSISEECKHCYALLLSKLFSRGKATWGAQGNRWIRHEAAVKEILKLDADAARRGVRERVFVNSMSDTFEGRDDLNGARVALFSIAEKVTNLNLLLLTKRPQNVCGMVPPAWLVAWPAHVWIGTTAGTQASADERVPELLKIPAKVRFLSCEPLLDGINLRGWLGSRRFGNPIHWIICGGESGAGARPMHPGWARSLRDQCADAGVPFFFKQWGEWYPFEENVQPGDGVESFTVDGGPKATQIMGSVAVARVGKAAAGRLLDDVDHSAFPGGEA